jgi:hypothetical protein
MARGTQPYHCDCCGENICASDVPVVVQLSIAQSPNAKSVYVDPSTLPPVLRDVLEIGGATFELSSACFARMMGGALEQGSDLHAGLFGGEGSESSTRRAQLLARHPHRRTDPVLAGGRAQGGRP